MLRVLLLLLLLLLFIPTLVLSHSIDKLNLAYSNKDSDYQPRTRHLDGDGKAKFVNHLILAKSPYLLQHAHNPINWYSWSDEAFNKARAENKLIFLSIGYSTCHWCHVMEEESFDDLEVAELMNEHFIAIKVDREIQPDIDATFMNISQLTTGGSGWPLNVFLTPDGEVFLTDTYITKGRLVSIIPQIQFTWKSNPNEIIGLAEQSTNIVDTEKNNWEALKVASLDQKTINKTTQAILSTFDEIQGGFGQAPKFPHENLLLFLIDEQKRNPSDFKLDVITTTLDAMATGGFYDVIGGGFHRYSIDNAWMVPHFEKMLYNQAQLALVYTRAYQITHKPLYRRIAKKTLDYVLREMKNKNGGFYSATDADSEGKEGGFFVWSSNELKSILNDKEYQTMFEWLDLSENTEFEDKNIIRFRNINNIQPNDYNVVDSLINTIYKARRKRTPPLTDNKVLLSWNALMIQSFIEAGQVFNDQHYLDVGTQTAEYLFKRLFKDEKLYRLLINQDISIPALFEDYAHFSNTLLSIFDYTNNFAWLKKTERLIEQMNAIFWDKKNFGFNMNAGRRHLNLNIKQIRDGALPSANGTAYKVLIKLYQRTGKKSYLTRAQQLVGAFSSLIKRDPYSYVSFVHGLNSAINGESSNIKYAYNGKIRIQSKKLENNQVVITLDLSPIWHINSNQPIQSSLTATKVTNLDAKHWEIKWLDYPKGEVVKLGFSKDKISIYKGQVKIKLELLPHSKDYIAPKLSLALQACSDKVCLPPTILTLKP